MQADGSEEQIKGMYLTQITEDGDLAVLSGSNQYHVSDKVIRGQSNIPLAVFVHTICIFRKVIGQQK